MSKIGIGVGEDFPVDDAKGPPAPPPGGDDDGERRHWRRRFFLHVLTRVVLLALVIAALVWMFSPHYYFYPGPYAHLQPYGYYPYPHHFFFFPLFPLLLIAFFVFAWRRRGCYGHRRHWHDEHRGHYREEA